MKRTVSLAYACFLALGLASGAQALQHRTYSCPAGDMKSLWDSLSLKSCSNFIATIDTTGQDGSGTCCQLCGDTNGCTKFVWCGNGRTSACHLYRAGAKKTANTVKRVTRGGCAAYSLG